MSLKIFFKSLLILIMIVLLSSCGDKKGHPPIEVLNANFGYLDFENGKEVWKKSSVVPYKVGQKYGWKIQYRSNKQEITYSEILILPEPSKNWNFGKDIKYQISDDKKNAIVQKTLKNNGVLHGAWEISDGDPKGITKIAVLVDGKKIHVFEFEIN